MISKLKNILREQYFEREKKRKQCFRLNKNYIIRFSFNYSPFISSKNKKKIY